VTTTITETLCTGVRQSNNGSPGSNRRPLHVLSTKQHSRYVLYLIR